MSNDQATDARPATLHDIGKGMNAFLPSGEDEATAAEEQDVETSEEQDAELQTEQVETEKEEEQDEVSEEEDAEPSDEADEESFMTLVVDGEQVPITTREEIQQLAQKGMHYGREMQKLRESERTQAAEHEQRLTQLRTREDQYAAALTTLEQTFGGLLGDEPNWPALYEDNPEEYASLRAQWDQLGAIRAEQQRIAEERQKEQKKKIDQWLQDEADKLRNAKPEWSDEQTRAADYKLILDYVTSIGGTEEELGQIGHHLLWIALHDAARYQTAQKAGKKKVSSAKAKSAAPGGAERPDQGSKQIRDLRKELADTGDAKVAGRLLGELLEKKG